MARPRPTTADQAAADRCIGAAQILERTARQLRLRAQWLRRPPAYGAAIDHADWASSELESGCRRAQEEIANG